MKSIVGLLELSPVFVGLHRSTLQEMADEMVREMWPKDCDIQGRPGPVPRFRLIARGRVKITRSNSHDGREVTLWLLGPGDVFDVIALLDDRLHVIHAWTLEGVETLAVPISVMRQWLDRSVQFRVAMSRYIAQQLRALVELASDLALHDTMTRLAHLLLRDFDDRQQAEPAKINLIRDLPQEEIASLIGSVRVVVSRLLARLKEQAIVGVHHGAIHVLDLKRLLRLAESHHERPSRAV
jgi:CRP/FNR family transcriptional regulator, cyclic AMP receptor protein